MSNPLLIILVAVMVKFPPNLLGFIPKVSGAVQSISANSWIQFCVVAADTLSLNSKMKLESSPRRMMRLSVEFEAAAVAGNSRNADQSSK